MPQASFCDMRTSRSPRCTTPTTRNAWSWISVRCSIRKTLPLFLSPLSDYSKEASDGSQTERSMKDRKDELRMKPKIPFCGRLIPHFTFANPLSQEPRRRISLID